MCGDHGEGESDSRAMTANSYRPSRTSKLICSPVVGCAGACCAGDSPPEESFEIVVVSEENFQECRETQTATALLVN